MGQHGGAAVGGQRRSVTARAGSALGRAVGHRAHDHAGRDLDGTGHRDRPARIIDYDVWYRKQGEVIWTDHPFTGTATQTTLTGLTAETTYEVQVRARNSDSASAWSPPGEEATAGNNLPPQFLLLSPSITQRSVPENSPPGYPDRRPGGTAIDQEGHPLTYTLREALALLRSGFGRPGSSAWPRARSWTSRPGSLTPWSSRPATA